MTIEQFPFILVPYFPEGNMIIAVQSIIAVVPGDMAVDREMEKIEGVGCVIEVEKGAIHCRWSVEELWKYIGPPQRSPLLNNVTKRDNAGLDK